MVTCSYSFDRDLGVGSSGADVAELQLALQEAGFLSGSGLVTGRFGEETRLALARFQTARKIEPADGRFGPSTRQVLDTRSVTGTERVLDLELMCEPGRLSFLGSFGHTDIEFVARKGGMCELRYRVESEAPDVTPPFVTCAVPVRAWTLRYSNEIGIDLSPFRDYCRMPAR